MSDYPGAAWLARYRERVNGDAELKVIGDWFTTTFGLTFGDTRYAVTVEKGRPRFSLRWEPRGLYYSSSSDPNGSGTT